jgi:transposase InsO family protein
MRADDVTETLNLALKASGCDRAEVVHKPRPLSDNGSSYIAGDMADWLIDQGMVHIRGAPKPGASWGSRGCPCSRVDQAEFEGRL